jgi:hypothetical protein
MNIIDMEMHDRLDLLDQLAPIIQELAGIGRGLEKLAGCLDDIHPPVTSTTPRVSWTPHPRWHTPTPGTGTPRPPHLPPAPVHAPLTQLVRAWTPAPPGPWALTSQQCQQILDELRRADAVAWLPNRDGGYGRRGRLARPRRHTR